MKHLPALVALLTLGAAATPSVTSAVTLAATSAAVQGIRGHVYDSETGVAVSAARVILRDRTKQPVAQGTTDDDGEFRIELESTGLYTVSIERSGYPSDVWATVEVTAGAMVEVEVVITPDDVETPRVVVTQEMLVSRLAREGYYERKRRSRGAFIEPTQDDVRRRIRVGELIRREASRVRIQNGVAAARSTRGGGGLCPLKVLLDGIDTNSVRLEGRQRYSARDIQAIEVYWSEFTVPPRWQQTVMTGASSTRGGRTSVCGVVVIWLR